MKTILKCATITAGIGALFGFSFVWIVDFLRPSYDHTSNWGISFIFALGGAGVGLFLGLIVGAIIVAARDTDDN